METSLFLLPLAMSLLSAACAAVDPNSWSIMEQNLTANRKELGLMLDRYCSSWRLNVELNNIRGSEKVPVECVSDVESYMATQYRTDILLATELSSLYLTFEFARECGEKDAWIFDVDDTLLTTLPYLSQHLFGGEKINMTEFEEWKAQGTAPCIVEIQSYYLRLKQMGFKIFIITSRPESLRDATVYNLLQVGYEGWNRLIMRQARDGYRTIEEFKSAEGLKLMEEGYRIWGIMGDQWSSLLGLPSAAKRFFKLPNPMYYDI